MGEPQEKGKRAGDTVEKQICLERIAKFGMYARCRPGLKERDVETSECLLFAWPGLVMLPHVLTNIAHYQKAK